MYVDTPTGIKSRTSLCTQISCFEVGPGATEKTDTKLCFDVCISRFFRTKIESGMGLYYGARYRMGITRTRKGRIEAVLSRVVWVLGGNRRKRKKALRKSCFVSGGTMVFRLGVWREGAVSLLWM